MKELALRGHKVTGVGPGHEVTDLFDIIGDVDHTIEIDAGRDKTGEFCFQVPKHMDEIDTSGHKFMENTSVWFIDTHGQPSLHKRYSYRYEHVFFAVYARSAAFAKHRSAYWCPNATDLEWFPREQGVACEFDFGFFGSKTGLDRADPLIEICEKNGYTYDVRAVCKARRHQWPTTGEAMAKCRVLFNHGQKHDGPNQRVLESMAVGRPLLNDIDGASGMGNLFTPGKHYIGYEAYTYSDLEEKMAQILEMDATEMVEAAYQEVLRKHTISNRVGQMMEVIEYGS